MVIVVLHFTVAPPPLPEPLHWAIVIGTGVVALLGAVQITLIVPPPPLPDILHWLIVGVGEPGGGGLQTTVGWVPPP